MIVIDQPRPSDEQERVLSPLPFAVQEDAPPADNDLFKHVRRFSGLPGAIRHHRRWLISVALIVLFGALIVYTLMPRRFTVAADLWLDHGFERLDPGVPAAAGSSASPLARNTEVRLLTSSELAGGVVDRLGLANLRGLGQPKDGPLLPRETARRLAIEHVLDNLQVETNGTSYAVAVRYTAADPVLAAGILNHLIESYVADRRSGGARGRQRAAMQAQVAGARDEAIRNLAAMNGYRDALNLLRRQTDRTSLTAEIVALDAAARTATLEQRTAEAWLRDARGGAAGGMFSPRIHDLRARLALSTDDPGSPARAAIERDLAGETQRLAESAKAARVRTQLLQAARTRADDTLRQAEIAAAELSQIGVRAATAQARYADFARRYQALVVAQRNQRGTAYVISRGAVSTARGVPDPMVFALGALAAALVAVIAAFALLEALTKGFRSRQHFERTLGVPVIGMVPDLDEVRDADFAEDDPMGPPDYLYNHRHSAFSAAFRAIHTGLRLGVSGNSLRSIVVSSALPEEGKTTVALCLARSAALAGLRVVLVDCDARRPAASRALSPYVKTGLAHVLEDGVDFHQVVQCDTPSGAWFLAQGSNRLVVNGSVASPGMAALIRQLEREYDLVLLDTAPALALSEARELAAMADGVLLVARARKTPVEATRMAQEQLERAGAKVVAATLTMIDP